MDQPAEGIAVQNGKRVETPTQTGETLGVVGGGLPSSLPPSPLPSSPQRICFAQNHTVHNPGITFSTPEPLCGQATRKAMMDAVTFEKDMVTCPECLKKIAGCDPLTNDPPKPPPQAPLPPFDVAVSKSFKELVDRVLDVEQLKARKLELVGELAALNILLQAAEAMEKAREV